VRAEIDAGWQTGVPEIDVLHSIEDELFLPVIGAGFVTQLRRPVFGHGAACKQECQEKA